MKDRDRAATKSGSSGLSVTENGKEAPSLVHWAKVADMIGVGDLPNVGPAHGPSIGKGSEERSVRGNVRGVPNAIVHGGNIGPLDKEGSKEPTEKKKAEEIKRKL